jgi:hypothetical protein
LSTAADLFSRSVQGVVTGVASQLTRIAIEGGKLNWSAVAADGLGAVTAGLANRLPNPNALLDAARKVDVSKGVLLASNGNTRADIDAVVGPTIAPTVYIVGSPYDSDAVAMDIVEQAAGDRVMRMQTDSLAEARASTQAYYSDLRDRLTQSPPTAWGGMKYTGARFNMLAADVFYDGAEGLRGAYRFVTDAEVRSQTATQVRTLLQNPEMVKDAVVKSAQEFWAAPVDQKAEMAFKGLLSTALGAGSGKALATTGRLAGNGLEYGVKTLGPMLDDAVHNSLARNGFVLNVVPDAPRMEGYNAANSAGAPRITLQQRTANHNAHLDDIAGQLREQGYTVKGNGARFYDSTGQNYTHTDLFAIRPNGEPIIIEMKTGGAVNTTRQNQIYPQILTGNALPSRPVARMLGIKPNVPLNQQGYTNGIPIYQVKALGL